MNDVNGFRLFGKVMEFQKRIQHAGQKIILPIREDFKDLLFERPLAANMSYILEKTSKWKPT